MLVCFFGSYLKQNKNINMDILPSGNIFRELQIIHDTGCFSSESSIEDQWQQASAYYSYTHILFLFPVLGLQLILFDFFCGGMFCVITSLGLIILKYYDSRLILAKSNSFLSFYVWQIFV